MVIHIYILNKYRVLQDLWSCRKYEQLKAFVAYDRLCGYMHIYTE
jgi:hypothetical protein